MSRKAKVIFIVVGLVVFSYFVRSQKEEPSQATNLISPSAATPQPAAAPTVEVPDPKESKSVTGRANGSHTQDAKTKKKSSTPGKENDDGESNINADLQSKLGEVVSLYAAWPGATPRHILSDKLRSYEPLITESTVKKIEKEWRNTPPAPMLKVKRVVNFGNLSTLPNDSNKATVTVFLALHKLFKPVSGRPYSQEAVQPYSVNLQIINRSWTVVGISPQSTIAQTGG
jgi:hypothetical protein